MAFSVVLSAGIRGMHVELVHVEADISNGLPVFHMVGYLSSEVKEAAERVRTAIRNADIVLPAKKIMVNLAPATMRKKGASYDLPIALAVLASLGVIPKEELERVLVIGELSLSGHVRKVSGILPIVKQARDAGCHTCILPLANRTEGNLVEGIRMIGVSHLKEALGYLTHTLEPEALAGREGKEETDGAAEELTELLDFAQVRGQQAVKRAAEVAAAGGHNLLLVGPPGKDSGKEVSVSLHLPHRLYTGQHYAWMSIFRNLFTNALEAEKSSYVQIEVVQNFSGDNCIFQITDHGPGIPEENQPEIFCPGFSTKINYETGEVSRGLGLNLVHDLIKDQFHGTISLESVPGKTTFTITVPKTTFTQKG